MEITEVRIKLTEDSDDRLQAFCSITFDDCFVVRDLKVIEGTNGPFVAMPSRKLTSHCSRCGCKNHLRACYCNQCGGKLNPDRAARDHEGRAKLYADIAHPVNSKCRELIQEHVIAAYHRELELAQEPGYVSKYDDAYEDDFTSADFAEHPATPSPSATPPPPTPAAPSPPTPVAPPATIQRTDTPTGPQEPRPPHIARAEPAPPTAPPQTPHSQARPKRGFGAGIFDE
jgi:stage V sporulation protein G